MTLTATGLDHRGLVSDEAVAELTEGVGREVAAAAEAFGLPGVAIGLVSAGGARAFASHGETNVDHALPVTSTTIFQAGSVSKLFTALAAMRMVENGELSLDDPVRTWLPELRLADADCAAKVTPRHLLQHTAGWRGDYDADTGRGEGALHRMLEVIASAPQLTPLGSTFHYNNLAFVLLGHVMATVRGSSFETLVRELVIDPIGMPRTGFFLEDLAFERIAAGHLVTKDGPVVSDWARPRSRGPNGGILTCAEDLATFAHFHLGDGTAADGRRMVDTETMRQMMSPSLEVRGTGDAICLGWMFNRWSQTAVLGHSGGTLGFLSRLSIVPEAGLGLVVLTNGRSGGKVVGAAQSALRLALVGDKPAAPAPVSRRDAMEGTFEGGIELRFDGDLTVRLGRGPDPVVCEVGEVSPDCLELVSGPVAGTKLDLLRNPDGSIAWLRVAGRLRAPV